MKAVGTNMYVYGDAGDDDASDAANDDASADGGIVCMSRYEAYVVMK